MSTSGNSLDIQSLMAQAVAEEGLDDFGNMDFVEPMKQFVDSVCKEGYLVPMALTGFGMGIVSRLKNRLRFQDDLKKHPEILEQDVSDPIIITGLARTGTTKLQRIMSADIRTQKLLFWMCMNPAPLKGSKGLSPDPRIALAKAASDALSQASPDFISAHLLAAEEPDEDCLLLEMSFECVSDAYSYRAPSYMTWLSGHPLHRAYADERTWLQYLQWQDGGRRGRPWVLKNPTHLGLLDEVLTTFPNATVVQCHRNPVVAVPSLCRLIEAIRPAIGSERVDPLELGEYFVTLNSGQWERQIEQLGRLKNGSNVLDVRYDRIRDDIIGVVREIYENRGMTLTPEAEQAMLQWEKNNPQHREGKHVYTLEHYGLSEKSVVDAFKTYFDHFPAEITR